MRTGEDGGLEQPAEIQREDRAAQPEAGGGDGGLRGGHEGLEPDPRPSGEAAPQIARGPPAAARRAPPVVAAGVVGGREGEEKEEGEEEDEEEEGRRRRRRRPPAPGAAARAGRRTAPPGGGGGRCSQFGAGGSAPPPPPGGTKAPRVRVPVPPRAGFALCVCVFGGGPGVLGGTWGGAGGAPQGVGRG